MPAPTGVAPRRPGRGRQPEEWGRTHKEHRGGGKGTPAQPLSVGGRRAERARARVKGNLRCDKSFSCMFLAGHKIEEHLIY